MRSPVACWARAHAGHARSRAGEDHPDTLTSASNLAADLRAVGEHQQARALNEDTLTRRRRVLGDDHPDTLTSANNLASSLDAVGEEERAAKWRAWATADRTSK